jgi:chromosome segregation ATPase
MLDGLVYNCILFMNGAITREDAYLLQRRAQTFTLGLLAIEQLTGPVKAQQAALTTEGGAAQGKSDVSAEATRLEAAESSLGNAQQAHAQAKSRLETLTTDRATQEAETKKAKEAYEAAAKKATGKSEESEEKKAEGKKLQELRDAEGELKKRDDALRSQDGEVKRLALAEKSAERQVKIAEDALQLAQSRQRAYTNAAVAFGASGGSAVTITDKIADSVVDIVQLVLVESGAGETCAALASDFRRKAT